MIQAAEQKGSQPDEIRKLNLSCPIASSGSTSNLLIKNGSSRSRRIPIKLLSIGIPTVLSIRSSTTGSTDAVSECE